VFCEGVPAAFGRTKAKEVFAYLVDRHGAGINTWELCAMPGKYLSTAETCLP
jgi:hypothetical protein